MDAPAAPQTAQRTDTAQAHHAWLVLREGDEVTGCACGTTFRARPAHRWTCEVSAHLHHGRTGRGGGRALCAQLLPRLAARGLRTATAAVALPDPASLALHRSTGSTAVGTSHRVGWELGAWRDVTWLERPLTEPGAEDLPPTELTEPT